MEQKIEDVNIFEISKGVLNRLSKMDYEKDGGVSLEKLIFPAKYDTKEEKYERRVSEQELRFLFVEEFRKKYPELFYSIETPTIGKFKFGSSYEGIKLDLDGRSASHDMCIYERNSGEYKRILNIEFKKSNSGIKNTGKDILKLIQEEQNGVFIHLLENTDKGTLPSVFKKLYKSFFDYQANWNNENKSIQIVIISLRQNKLIYCPIHKLDLINLKNIFSIKTDCKNITDFKEVSWK